MQHERIFSPDIGPDFNPSAVYYDLASREYRAYKFSGDDGIERGGFAKENRPVRVLGGLEEEVIIPVSAHGYQMSPIEASTGIPLPIVSSTMSRGNRGGADYHHAFFYDKIYSKKLEHRAVRYSRLQLVSQWAHTRFHQHFDGTAYPEDEHDAFKITILNCAGYVPAYGVHARKDELVIRPLRSNERYALRKPHSFISERYDSGQGIQRRSIGQFVMYYALAQNFDAVRRREVEEFLGITPEYIEQAPSFMQGRLEARRQQLARRLTNIAIDASVDPIREDFRQAQKQDLLRRGLEARDPWPVAKAQLGQKEPDYYDTLRDLLTARTTAAA